MLPPGKIKKVLEKLLKYDEVIEAHIITGQYDVLAVLEFELYGREIFASFPERFKTLHYFFQKINLVSLFNGLFRKNYR